MKALEKTPLWAAAVAAMLLAEPALFAAEPGETAKPPAGKETESMMSGAPNQDATLRDKSAKPGAPVEGADPGMVKSPPKKTDDDMTSAPPRSNADPGIHTPGASPDATPGER
jgi:hypothetical protein